MRKLTKLEHDRLNQFEAAHPGPIWVVYKQTGIGVAVTAKSEDGTTREITDFSVW